MKFRKSLAVIAGITVMLSLTACSGQINSKEVVATLGQEQITLGEANFAAKYEQAQYEQMYSMYLGQAVDWSMEAEEGKTLEDTTKQSIMDDLKKKHIVASHAKDYGITLSEEEKSAAAAAASKFISDNQEKDLKVIGADEEIIRNMLQLNTLYSKVSEAMVADVDTEVSDEEALQRGISYVFVSTEPTTDEEGNSVDLTEEEKAKKKADAEKIAGILPEEDFAAVATVAGYTASTASYGEDSTSLDPAVYEAADQLKEGEVSDVVAVDNGYYVIKLTSELDRDATDSKKESIVNERKSDAFDALYEEWESAVTFEIKEKVWKKVKFKDNIALSVPETAEDAENLDEETEGDATADVSENEANSTEAVSENEAENAQTEGSGNEADSTEAVSENEAVPAETETSGEETSAE